MKNDLEEFHVDWEEDLEQSCDLRWLLKLKAKNIDKLCTFGLNKTLKAKKEFSKNNSDK